MVCMRMVQDECSSEMRREKWAWVVGGGTWMRARGVSPCLATVIIFSAGRLSSLALASVVRMRSNVMSCDVIVRSMARRCAVSRPSFLSRDVVPTQGWDAGKMS